MENSAEDLYTKIALDNKLVTKFQVRKACEEQDELAQGGNSIDLGQVMVRMGYLSDRQHQSVLNACRYRRQRDYDKRFARQVMRMDLISQDELEQALDKQKAGYTKTGTVAPLADQLAEDGMLDEAQIESVHKGIQERDRLRAQARKGGAGALNMKVSGPTPVLDARPSETGAVEADDDDVKLDLDDEDLDDVDLDDDDLDGLDDLDDEDLDDDDLSDIGDIDLDDDDLDDVDLDDDEDLDDEDLDDIDLDGSAEDLDDDELEDASLSDVDELDEDLDDDDLDDIKLDLGDLDDEDLSDLDDGDDESDLAADASELDSEVQLDPEHIKDLEEIGSGEDEPGGGGWAAEAFDDRPLNKRPPSDAYPIPAGVQATEPPPRPEPIPVTKPPGRPKAPVPPSSRLKAAPVEAAIPGGDVFEGNLSDMGRVADFKDDDFKGSGRNKKASGRNKKPSGRNAPASDTRTALDIPTNVIDSDIDRVHQDDMRDPEEAASEERRAMIDSAVNDAVKAALQPPSPPPTPSGSGVVPPEPLPDLANDPRLRRAFERAMEAAWKVFLEELRGDFGG